MISYMFRPLLALLVLLGTVAAGQAQPFPPPGNHGDASLAEFILQLQEGVESRDREYILSIVHEDCTVSFGGFQGRADFEDYWFGPASTGRDFFEELEQAMLLGGTWHANGLDFVFPYTSTAQGVDEQGILLGVVTAPQINVRAWPGLKGRVVGKTGHELVRLCNIEVPVDVDGMDWTCILLVNGKRGYVATKYLEVPSARPFVFRKIEGRWMLFSTVTNW